MIKKGIQYILLLIVALAMLLPSAGISQNATKRGGIGFRIDENPPISKVHSYDSLFSKYGQKYSFAVTSYILPLVPQYVDTLKALSLRGIELMDNTPTHATQFFNVLNYQDANLYSNKPGVDHINGQKVCLKYSACDTTHPHGEGYINIFGNKVISYEPGEFHDLLSPSAYFAIYLGHPVDSLCLFYNVQSVNTSDPDTLYLRTIWDETKNFSDRWHFLYHKIQNNNVVMHDSAVKILGKRSLDIFDSLHLPRPYTWIHPDGPYPWINPLKLQASLGVKLGFQQSTSFINPSLFCYNEFDPGKNKQFAINSEALSMESSSFKSNSHIIAEAIAKHYVLFDFARLTNSYGGWNAYLHRMDSLLVWCSSNNIPIRTYSQWKVLLYDSIAQKVVNIFPKLDVDIDHNGWPDGFDFDTLNIQGRFDASDGPPSGGGKSFKIEGGGTICKVTGLAGLEKRSNKLTVYTRCLRNHQSNIQVEVSFPGFSQTQTFEIKSDSTAWMPYTKTVDVPDSANTANFTLTHDTVYHDTVKISGFDFRSSGFLNKSRYPLQEVTANAQFPLINMNDIVIASVYDPLTISWTFRGNHSMRFSVDTAGLMKSLKPSSFWIGKDSVFAIAHSQDGAVDSCFFRFRSDSIPTACAGGSINIAILDTITGSDYIVWTSSPYDSTMTDTTIYNPTVSPVKSTLYRVKVYNILGNIVRDSIYIIRHPIPVPGLFKDSTICRGDSIVLHALEGTRFLWNTGDTTASIKVRPDSLTMYTVHVTTQWDCSADDTTLIHVAPVPAVKLSGLIPQYCINDTSCYLLKGDPGAPPGIFGGSSGVKGSQFCPQYARAGKDTVWYQEISHQGCYNADTVYVTVNALPVIPKLRDTTLCTNKSIYLNGGTGADNYLWSNGDTTQYTVINYKDYGLGKFIIGVYATKAGCVSKDTALISFIKCPDGVYDLSGDEQFSVYPNPFNESISILMKDQAGAGDNASLLDLRGELVASCPIKDKTTSLTVSDIKTGVYILLVKHNNRQYYLKVVKF